MGGSAFGPDLPASRITTSDYVTLEAILRGRLANHFKRMEHLRFFADKETHGDVDLLCAWVAPAWAFTSLNKTSIIDDDARASGEADRDGFVQEVAKTAGAVRWRTSGAQAGSLEIHLGIPTSLLGCPETAGAEHDGLAEANDDEAFYQVDLLLCPPAAFDFRLFNGSYSTTNIILGQAVRGIAYELTLREEDFILRHTPIDEVPRVDVILTANVVEFCAWLGLDYPRWQMGFANRDEFWAFMIDVAPYSNMAYSLRGLARKHKDGYVLPVGARARVGELIGYYEWLQTTKWADLDGRPPGFRRTLLADGAEEHVTSSSTNEALYARRKADIHPYPLGIEVKEINDPAVLRSEITKPSRWPMKPQALRALNYWGTRTAYFDEVAKRREIKKVILRSRLRRVQREAVWGRIISWLGGFGSGVRKTVAVVVSVKGYLVKLLGWSA